MKTNPMTPPRTIDEILAKFADEWYLNVITDIHSKAPKQVIDQATTAIKQLLRGAMPKKQKEIVLSCRQCEKAECQECLYGKASIEGFNQALTEMDKVIEGL